MTAIDEFLSIKREKPAIIHNSQIIIERLEEIEGTSQNPIDVGLRWLRKQSYKRYPFLDTVIDFASILFLETVLRIFDFRVKEIFEGRDKIPDTPVIFATNHETETEHLYLARACVSTRDLDYFKFLKPLNFKGIANKSKVPIFFAKYQLFNLPLIGSVLASTAFPVERELRDVKSMEIGSLFLQQGSNIIIYPEGTRNLEAQVKAKSGVIRLAIQNKVPIIPIGHVGLFDITKGKFIPQKKGIWYCTFGDPINYEEYYDKDLSYEELRILTQELMDKIKELKAHGRSKIEEIEESERKSLSNLSIMEIVVNRFEKLEKKPKNPFDLIYRKVVNAYSKIPMIGKYLDAFTHLGIRIGTDLLINPLTFDINIRGRENIVKTKPAIVVSNHESFLDILIYALKFVPDQLMCYHGYFTPSDHHDVNEKIWFVMKKELAEVPLVSSFVLSAGGFPIARGEKDKDALPIANELLKKKRVVVFFPQQTTHSTIDIDSGKTGAIRLAIETGLPIVPVSMKGSYAAMQKGIWNLLVPPKGYPIEVNIGKPIYYNKYQGKELKKDDYQKLMRELMIKIKKMRDGVEVPEFNPEYDGENSKPPLTKLLERIGKLFKLPRKELQEVKKESFISKAINKLTDAIGITSTEKIEGGPKKFAKLSPIDSALLKLKKRGEKYGLFPWLDNVFYKLAKNAVELLVNGLYDFKINGREKIPMNKETGVIFLTQSKTQLDLVIGNALIPEKVHFMIDKKTYEKPLLSTILQSLGFFRKTESPDDFEPLLDLKEKLKQKKMVGVFPTTKNRERLIRTIAGVIKLAIEGKPTVIVPLAISGTETPFPPVKIRVEIGEPIPIKRMKRDARYKLAEEITGIIKVLKQKAFEARYE
ncbi:MAG: lysophospholipid acyltransferase family protein [Promethearchaeota archaeon]